MVESKGAAALRAWLDKTDKTQEWLAEQLGTRQTSVSGWLKGKQPKIGAAIAIEALTGIAVAMWAVPARRRPSTPPKHAA